MRAEIKTLVLSLPIILVAIVFFYFPILVAFTDSTQDLDGSYIGFERYLDLLNNSDFTSAFVFTVEIALISTFVSVVLSVVIALALRDTFVGKRIALFLNQMNVSMPHMIVALSVLYLLGQKGFISTVMYNAGQIDTWSEFPPIADSPSPMGAIVSYCLKFTPFICISVLAVLQSMSQEYEDQSYTLGVGKLKTFFHVTLPSIWPALMTAGLISFTYAFGSYDVPTVLLDKGVMSTYVYNNYYNYLDPYGILKGYAGSVIMAVIVLILSATFLYISSKRSDALE